MPTAEQKAPKKIFNFVAVPAISVAMWDAAITKFAMPIASSAKPRAVQNLFTLL